MLTNVKSKLREVQARTGYAREALSFIWEAAPGWTVAWIVLLAFSGTLPAITVYLTKLVVDTFAQAIGQGVGWETVRAVAGPAVAMAGVLLFQRIASGLQEWVSVGQSEHVTDFLKERLHERAAAADYAFYESSAYHDLLEQANTQASTRVLQLTRDGGSFIQATIGFLSLGFVLIQYGWVVPALLVAGAVPAFLVLIRYNRIQHTWWQESTPRRRLSQYYDLMLTVDAGAAELRMNRLGHFFRHRYQLVRRALRNERLDILRRQLTGRFVATLFALVATGAAMGWVALAALRGEATLGDLALFYTAFNQGQSMLGSVLGSVGQLYTNTLFLEQVFAFLNQENEIRDPENPHPFPAQLRSGVVFDNVTFTYPGASEPALENFSLEIPAHKMIAIVGENGAGKSTFIKLLCRFYDPSDGRVLIDGRDIREYEIEELRRRISVMFQFPMKYQMTARENIALGNLPAEALDLEAGGSLEDVRQAARKAGASGFLEAMPRQYETLLGRWFAGGTELSGGEWQRVALARAFLRRAPLIILDEPTSFMDSWAENEWIQRFKSMVEGRTALIITHRFTTAMQADVIHVVQDGHIVESGTHGQLLRLGGKYASSWTTQMERAQSEEAISEPPVVPES